MDVSQHVVIRTPSAEFDFAIDETFENYSKSVVELIRNRRLWRNVDQAREEVAKNCREYLKRRDFRVEEAVRSVVAAGGAEVAIPQQASQSASRLRKKGPRAVLYSFAPAVADY